MEIVMAPSVKIALRTLSQREQSRVGGLFDALRNWENDPHIRKMSRELPDKGVYVLTASDGTRIFFQKEDSRVVILDIARKTTIDQFVDAE